jgi:hypothetical protein
MTRDAAVATMVKLLIDITALLQSSQALAEAVDFRREAGILGSQAPEPAWLPEAVRDKKAAREAFLDASAYGLACRGVGRAYIDWATRGLNEPSHRVVACVCTTVRAMGVNRGNMNHVLLVGGRISTSRGQLAQAAGRSARKDPGFCLLSAPPLNDMAGDAGKSVSPLPDVSWPTRGRPRGFLTYTDVRRLFQAMPFHAADELWGEASGPLGIKGVVVFLPSGDEWVPCLTGTAVSLVSLGRRDATLETLACMCMAREYSAPVAVAVALVQGGRGVDLFAYRQTPPWPTYHRLGVETAQPGLSAGAGRQCPV